MSTPTRLLITGATGKQGGAVIDALLATPPTNSPIEIYAVTRTKTSPSAARLVSKSPLITIIEGDLDNPSLIFSQTPTIHAVFSVQANTDAEETQGKSLIDTSILHGVRHIVYSSGDRGGPTRSATDPTTVKNFAAKYRIEKHLETRCAAAAATYTILRPVTFYENLTPDVHGKGFARMWEQMGTEKRLQMVSTRDIGWFGARALLASDSQAEPGAVITLAGDELTQAEAAACFKDVVGKPMPLAPCLLGSALKLALRDTVGDMFRWFAEVGYGADVHECRKVHPEMQDFRTWLEGRRGAFV
ncbi:MAG: hypothetical protein M4579_007203 [Chaenotheca gracillima]|nr:MAG: hypothetical protein M4579_007203 [Chaenotheca gracillima]